MSGMMKQIVFYDLGEPNVNKVNIKNNLNNKMN